MSSLLILAIFHEFPLCGRCGKGASDGGDAAGVVEVMANHFFGKWLFPLTIDMHITMCSVIYSIEYEGS